MNTNIRSEVMLCSVTISTWVARRFDGNATEEVENKRHAKGTGRFNKRLLPENSRSFQEVVTLAGCMRKDFYDHSLKYDQLGVRLLPTMIYIEFADRMRSMKDEFDLAVSVLLTDYLDLKERARTELNGLFNEADYPTLAELSSRFGVKMAVLPFPDASQFGVDMPADVLASIATANDNLVERMYMAVFQMVSRLYATGSASGRGQQHARSVRVAAEALR